MSYSEKPNQIDLVLHFEEIQLVFDSFRKTPADKMISDLEKYDAEHGIRLSDSSEDLQLENVQSSNLCYKLNPRKLIFGVCILALIALIFWFYLF